MAPFAPWPTRNVTFEPALMMAAALAISLCGGVIAVEGATALDRETHVAAFRHDHFHRLNVVGNDDHRGLQAHASRPKRGIDHYLRLLWRHDGLHVDRDVGKDAFKIIFLLREGPK